MKKITYSNKVDLRTNDVPEINKVTASTLNEVKNVVNETVDQVVLNLNDIGQTVKITGDQSIAGVKTFTDDVNTTQDLHFVDNGKAVFGTSNGLQIWTTGANDYITSNFNSLALSSIADNKSVDINTTKAGGTLKVAIRASGSTGATSLFHLGNEKLETTSTGVAVTGDISAVKGNFTGLVTMTDRLDLRDDLDNTFIGEIAGAFNSTGGNNLGVGRIALGLNTTGSFNTSIGTLSLESNTTGGYNVGLGFESGRFIADGTTPNETGGNSIFIGHDTRSNADGETNQIVIGDTAIGKGSNTVTLGNDSITNTYLKGDVSATNGLFSGALTLNNRLLLGSYVEHVGDDDTYFGFSNTNNYKVTVGGNDNILSNINAVSLAYAGALKFITTSTGATLTGDLSANAATFASSVSATKLLINSSTNQIELSTGDIPTFGTLNIGHFSNGAFIGTIAGSNTASNILRLGASGTTALTLNSDQSATFASSVSANGNGTFGTVGATNNSSVKAFDGTIVTKIQSQTAGDTAGAIGTESNHDLKIVTNNIERLRITASGAATFASSVSATAHVTTGGTSSQFVKGDGSLSAGYKVYTALLTQSGTSAPSATVLENTLGGTVTLTYVGAGNYGADLTGAFTANKTAVIISNGVPVVVSSARSNDNRVSINCGSSNDRIANATIEIRVYN
tara:strand:- start:79 stop:2118 length:2040 start_codon:yes stop_codon:yes gene_type:complete